MRLVLIFFAFLTLNVAISFGATLRTSTIDKPFTESNEGVGSLLIPDEVVTESNEGVGSLLIPDEVVTESNEGTGSLLIPDEVVTESNEGSGSLLIPDEVVTENGLHYNTTTEPVEITTKKYFAENGVQDVIQGESSEDGSRYESNTLSDVEIQTEGNVLQADNTSEASESTDTSETLNQGIEETPAEGRSVNRNYIQQPDGRPIGYPGAGPGEFPHIFPAVIYPTFPNPHPGEPNALPGVYPVLHPVAHPPTNSLIYAVLIPVPYLPGHEYRAHGGPRIAQGRSSSTRIGEAQVGTGTGNLAFLPDEVFQLIREQILADDGSVGSEGSILAAISRALHNLYQSKLKRIQSMIDNLENINHNMAQVTNMDEQDAQVPAKPDSLNIKNLLIVNQS